GVDRKRSQIERLVVQDAQGQAVALLVQAPSLVRIRSRVEGDKRTKRDRVPSNGRGAGLGRRMARKPGRCRIDVRRLGTRGARLSCCSLGGEFPSRLSPKKRTRLRR